MKRINYLINKILIIFIVLSLCISFSINFLLIFANKNTEKVYADDTVVETEDDNQYQTTANINISTKVFKDNQGYQGEYSFEKPLGSSWLNLRINTTNPAYTVQKHFNTFLIDSSSGDSESIFNNIVIEANYNFDKTENIKNNYNLSSDTAYNVLNIKNLGQVGTGAFIVEKSEDGKNYYRESSPLKTTNVTKVLSPQKYNTTNQKYRVAYVPKGTDLNKGIYIRIRFAYEIYRTTYKYYDKHKRTNFESYTHPDVAGIDYSNLQSITEFLNILETAEFYICNNSGNVGFHNLSNNIESIKDFILDGLVNQEYQKSEEKQETNYEIYQFRKKYEKYLNGEKDENGEDIVITREEKINFYNLCVGEGKEIDDQELTLMANQYYLGETLQDGDMTLKGFSIDNLGNNNNQISYRHNGIYKGQARNGQMFLEQGRYDFIVDTPYQKHRRTYTIYINNRAETATIQDYFDTTFITANSKRVYDLESQYPVYVKGSINYQIKNDRNRVPLSGKICRVDENNKLTDVYKFLYDNPNNDENVIKLQKEANNVGALDLEVGLYNAIFVTTDNFLEDITGDYYTFNFVFKVVDESQVTGPIVNQSMLNSFSNVSTFYPKYYGVEYKNVNDKTVTFAFSTSSKAYDFAYDIENNKVIYNNGKYIYDGNQYDNAHILSQVIDENVKSKIKEKYFDASDMSSYLSIDEQTMKDIVDTEEEVGKNVLNLPNIKNDVVVISTTEDIENFRVGEPFLNDGKMAYIDENGQIVETKTDLCFISIEKYESNSIQAVNIDTLVTYNLEYDRNVEAQLRAMNAPSGVYKIVESNLYNDGTSITNEYYGTYIAQENTSQIFATYLLDGQIKEITLDKSNNETTLQANSLVISTIENDLDEYSIVKITHNGETKILGIWELTNYKLDKEGSYIITVVDRLGNILNYSINIVNAVESVIIHYEDETTQIGFVGLESILKNDLTKDNYDFKGWTYEGAESEYTLSITPTNAQDIYLQEVWHHKQVNIIWKDGDFTESTLAKPEDTIEFDKTKFHKEGFELVGFMWEHDGQNTLFTYRISSVPNVEEMTITAIYKKKQSSFSANGITLIDGENVIYNCVGGEEFPTLQEIDGMTFVGWMLLGVEDGIVYNGVIPNLDGNVTLTAVYVTTVTSATENTNAGVFAGIIGEINNIANVVYKGIINNYQIILPILLVCFVAIIVINKRKIIFNYINKLISQYREFRFNKINDKINNKINECTSIDSYSYNSTNNEGVIKATHKLSAKCLVTIMCLVIGLIIGLQGICVSFIKSKYIGLQKSTTYNYVIDEQELYQDMLQQLENAKNDAVADYQNKYNESSSSLSQLQGQVSQMNTDIVNDGEFTMTDDEAFMYVQFYNLLTALGYYVFPAKVNFDNTTVYGFGYSDGLQNYKNIDEEGVKYVGAGFTAFMHQAKITDYAITQGLTIVSLVDDLTYYEEERCILAYEETFLDEQTLQASYQHYIYNNKYVRYTAYDYAIHCTFTEIDDWNTIESVYDKNAGDVYSYDEERVVYSPSWNKDSVVNQDMLASSLNNDLTLEQAKAFYNSFIEMQDENYMKLESDTNIFISTVNLNEVYLQLQQESMFDVTAEQWAEIEKQLSEGVYVYLVEKQETDKDGNLIWLDENGNKTTTKTDTPSMIVDTEYSVEPIEQEVNGALIALGVILFLGALALTLISGGTAAASLVGATVNLTAVIAGAICAAVAGFYFDVSIQVIEIGMRNGSINEINWNRAIISGVFDGISFGYSKYCKFLGKGLRFWGNVSIVLLQGVTFYSLAKIEGKSDAEVLEEFGWGILLGLTFKAIDVVGTLTGKAFSSIIKNPKRLSFNIRKSDDAIDKVIGNNNKIIELDEESKIFIQKALPSEKKFYYYVKGQKVTKEEFVKAGATGEIEPKGFFKQRNPFLKPHRRIKVENGAVDLSPYSFDSVGVKMDGLSRDKVLAQAKKEFAEKWRNAINDPKRFKELPKELQSYIRNNNIKAEDINVDFVQKVISGKGDKELANFKFELHETVDQKVLLIPSNVHKKISHFGGSSLYDPNKSMPECLKQIIKNAIQKLKPTKISYRFTIPITYFFVYLMS